MRETRTSGLMSGDGKRSDCHKAQATAPILDSTARARVRLLGNTGCQSASKFDPRSASNFDPLERRVRTVALAASELVGIAETARARVVW
jgi:hypothetical protein